MFSAGQCPEGWHLFPSTDNCYFVPTEADQSQYSWHDANAYCMQQGAHLASIHNDEERNFIKSKVCIKLCLERCEDSGFFQIRFGVLLLFWGVNFSVEEQNFRN